MKTEIYKFIIELPDGEEIVSDEYEYEYNDEDKNDEFDTYHYDNMVERMENDKIAFVFNTLTISHNKIKDEKQNK